MRSLMPLLLVIRTFQKWGSCYLNRGRVYSVYRYSGGLGQIWPEGHSGCRWVSVDWRAGTSGNTHVAMGTHLYIYIYKYMYTHTYTYMCLILFIYICVYIHICIYMYMFIIYTERDRELERESERLICIYMYIYTCI